MRTGSISKDLPEFANAPRLFDQMVSLFDLSTYKITAVESDEHTSRFLLQSPDDHTIESVLISMHHGTTLCLSSQIGCRMRCSFCRTGQLGLIRNLQTKEIVLQLFTARFLLNKPVDNIVFMGMGEPFDNYDAVVEAARIFADPNGCNIGPRHITISTSGDIDGIYKFASEKKHVANLTVSLNAPNEKLRQQLMPSTKKKTLHDLLRAMRAYCTQTEKLLYVSYVLIKGVNDDPKLADELAELLAGLPVRINLIPFNSFEEHTFQAPSQKTTDQFMNRLRTHAIPVFLRGKKGETIRAACGQLTGHKR